jgi:hypothetical protein
MKISFDFDNTLEFLTVQDFAKRLISEGHDVCILTTRYEDPTKYPRDVTEEFAYFNKVAKDLGIKETNFTNFQWKHTVIDSLGIDIHIDDNLYEEVSAINIYCKARCVHYRYGEDDWQNEVRNLISLLSKEKQNNNPN